MGVGVVVAGAWAAGFVAAARWLLWSVGGGVAGVGAGDAGVWAPTAGVVLFGGMVGGMAGCWFTCGGGSSAMASISPPVAVLSSTVVPRPL